MKTRMKLTAIIVLALFFVSCGGDSSDLKKIQEQTSGDFKVSILGENGGIKQGTGTFVVEFRNVSSNELVEVSDVSTDAVMQMAGMPMTGETGIDPTDTPGRFKVKYNFSMKGNWKFTVSFDSGSKVQFMLSVM